MEARRSSAKRVIISGIKIEGNVAGIFKLYIRAALKPVELLPVVCISEPFS